MRRSILVVAAHPDDEVLGCGAAMAGHARAGDDVHILILAEGLTSRDQKRDRSQHGEGLSQLAEAAYRAHGILGARGTQLESFPDNRMDSVALLDIVKVVEAALEKHAPSLVYTHHGGDLNIDHRIVHQAVVTASRPMQGSTLRTLLFFEVPSSTEWQMPTAATAFIPNWFVDATETLTVKLEALRAYASEMRPWPHPRSPEAVTHLARWRGASSGYEAAEAFQLGRHLGGFRE